MFIHLVVERLASVKQLRKCAADTVISELQGGAQAKDKQAWVGLSVLGRPHRVLPGHMCSLAGLRPELGSGGGGRLGLHWILSLEAAQPTP